MGTMGTTRRRATRRHRALRLGATGLAAVLLVGCSTERIMESALERVDGVGDVSIDAESGSFSVTGDDGEEFSVEVDSETGESTFRTHEGEVSTSPTQEVPDEIADAVTLPAAFAPVATSRGDVDGGTQLMLQGTVTGDFAALVEEIEQGVRAGGWDVVERQAIVEGHQAMIMGRDDAEDDDRGVMVTLMLGEGDDEGMLQVILLQP